jgi:hypothetical protein
MFHVKHFGPVPPQNLTWAKSAGALDEVRPGKSWYDKNREAILAWHRAAPKKPAEM